MSTVNLYNVHCMKFMRGLPDKAYDLAIVDPPYFTGPETRGHYGQKNSSIGVKRVQYPVIEVWKKPGPAYFKELRRVSRHQIIWGANHFMKAIAINSPGWIAWDKCNEATTFADVELAWTSFDRAATIFRFMWNGMLQGRSMEQGHIMQGNKALNEKRIHPTQKPVALYRWLLKNYAEPGMKILDTHGGSMSIAIACEAMGFDLDLCELNAIHFQAGKKRFEKWKAQPLFDNQPVQQLAIT